MRVGSIFKYSGLVAALCASIAACTKPAPPAKPAAPAKVENAVTEAALTTVVLTPAALKALRVETVVAESSVVSAVRYLGGEVTAPPGASVRITAPFAAVVLAPERVASAAAPEGGVIPGAGTWLTPRQPLLRLVAVPADRNLSRAAQELVVAEAKMREAEADLKRVTELYADRLVSTRDLEKAQTAATSARADVDAARSQAGLAKGDVSGSVAGLSALTITAPDGRGMLQNVAVSAGQVVSAGALLAEVVQLEKLWIRVPIYAGDQRMFERGGSASVQRLGGDQGRVIATARNVAAPPSADAASASVDMFFEVGQSVPCVNDGPCPVPSIRPGERVSVGLRLAGARSAALTLPVSAIVYDMNGGSWAYEQVDSLKYVRRRVAIDRVVDGKAVIAQGIVAGMRMVSVGVAELFGSEFGIGK